MRNIILILLIISCELENNSKEEPIARVNDNFLFFSDVQESLDENMSQNDSMLAVNSAINNWASKKLLYEKAIFNLSNSKQNELDQLVRSYESDLYISNYEKEWLKTRVDTIVSNDQLQSYYNDNKNKFRLRQDILLARFIELPIENFNKTQIVRSFRRLNFQDKIYLDSISLQFKSSFINDSVWLRPELFFNNFKIENIAKYNRYLKKKSFFEIKDLESLYLVYISDILRKNDYAPMSYVKPTLVQILLNKRKLEMKKQLKTDILKQGISENNFEIYD
ncbi:MAG: peptidyl-prolyl cis-trans isomerase [Bacteroidota bacterium]|nr:peptidyl-prolyl cis-trans isomerase [Bacteroidota bacterium]